MGIVISDERCRIIGRSISGGATGLLDAINLAPGFDYSERATGTNGVGTALVARHPVYVEGMAHFQERFADYACAGAPIIAPITGKVLGVVNLTCARREANPMMLALARQTASEVRDRFESLVLKPVAMLPSAISVAVYETGNDRMKRLEHDERDAIVSELNRSGGNRSEAAKRLGMSRATFYRRLARYGLGSPSGVSGTVSD